MGKEDDDTAHVTAVVLDQDLESESTKLAQVTPADVRGKDAI